LKDDPALAGCEVRVVAHDASHRQGPVRSAAATAALAGAPPPSDSQGTRRAPRMRIEPVEVLVDGNPAQLIDLSVLGAQVVSSSVLKPNQRVRFTLSDAGLGTVRCQGTVAWASFEMPTGQPARYRAGVEFSNANADAISAFVERHQARG
jgi:PilZ domain